MTNPDDDETDGQPFIERLAEIAAIDLRDGVEVPNTRLSDADLTEYHRKIDAIQRSRRAMLDQSSTLVVR